MRIRPALALLFAASLTYADAYSTLLQRYETQIKQQERQLRSLRRNLLIKQREAKRWEQKADSAKAQWTEAGLSVEKARRMVRLNQDRRQQSHSKAEEAQWTVLEHTTQNRAAAGETNYWAAEMYKRSKTPRFFATSDAVFYQPAAVLENLAEYSQTTQILAEKAQEKETALRSEEFRWQNEERKIFS